MSEREIGKILEGIENLKGRYSDQEGRLGNVENNINKLVTSFAAQPGKCLQKMEEKFVTKEKVKPIETMHGTIKKAAIFIFCSLITGVAVILTYVNRGLP